MKFQRAIGPLGLLFAGIGSVIGSGWLLGPLYVAQIAGPAAILSWIIGGVLMMVIALTFAELGTAYPVASGMIHYANESYGPLLSFLIGWMLWISSICVAPVETLAIVQYAASYLPGLVTTKQNAVLLTNTGILISSFIMLLMCVLNYYGAKFFSKANIIITSFKLLVPIATIILLLNVGFHPSNFSNVEHGGFFALGFQSVLASLPLGGVLYSFIGSNTVLQLAGETTNPKRNIPLALIGTVIFCICLYTLLQVTFINALTPDSLARGFSKLHYSGDTGPFAGMLLAVGLGWFVLFIYSDALISPFGTGFVFTASSARVGYGLSEIGFFPTILKKLNSRGTPLYYLIINYLVGLLLFLPFPGWQKLATFIISCFLFSYIIGPLALIPLRRKNPHLQAPFRLPYANTIACVAFYIANLLIFWTGWQTVSKMMIALSIGLAIYIYNSYKTKNHDWFSGVVDNWWVLPYFAGLTLFSYLGSYGKGVGDLPFGIDFLVIGVFTIAIYYLAINQSAKINAGEAEENRSLVSPLLKAE